MIKQIRAHCLRNCKKRKNRGTPAKESQKEWTRQKSGCEFYNQTDGEPIKVDIEKEIETSKPTKDLVLLPVNHQKIRVTYHGLKKRKFFS